MAKELAEKKLLYTRADVAKAKAAMLKTLADLSGGRLIPGCCTQGCCDLSAQEWAINPAPKAKAK